ncbi:MAG: hypothetical protein AAGN64_08245, partial [Bacteroidota bacterium]
MAKLVDQGVEFVANKVRPSLRFPDGTVIPVTARKGLYIVPMSVAAPGGAAAIGTYQLPMSSSEARASATERDAWAQALATWEFDADALGGASAGADEVELLWQEDSDRAPPQELVPAPDFLPPGEAAFVSRELARARLGYISQRRRNLMIARGLTKGWQAEKLRRHELASVDHAAQHLGESSKQPTPHQRREPGRATRAFHTICSDVGCPSVLSFGGNKYFVTFISGVLGGVMRCSMLYLSIRPWNSAEEYSPPPSDLSRTIRNVF